ncbi:MAG TPA: 1-acyl-sn-glycerol-3-phosphate acyltransferase [Thermosynechococcaceae cyanobacterium]
MTAIASPPPYRFDWFDRFCLWYPPGWLILFNRHWQHYKLDPQGWTWLEYPLFLIPGGFYLALLIRWVRLGLRSPQAQPVDPDPAYQQAFRKEILPAIVQHYFRGSLENLENLPTAKSVLLAMNHAGMCFPWDFVSLGWLLGQQRDWFVQPLAHPLFFEHPWLAWWLPNGWALALGGVPAKRHQFEQAIATGTTLLYAPEGWRGLAKGWRQRYHLGTFDPSFVRLSIQHRVPVLPIVCLGSEALHPFTFNIKWLAQRFKLPIFPLSPLMLAFVLFPSMGVWAMQSRLQFHTLPLWCPWEDLEPGELPSRSRLYGLAEKLRARLQAEIDRLQT